MEGRNGNVTLGAADAEAIGEYARLLNVAYDNGEARGGSMEWSDVDAALAKAVEAFGPAGAMYAAASDSIRHDEDCGFREVDIFFAEGHEPSDSEMSAAKLMKAYAQGDSVDWEAVDEAWELVRSSPSAAPSM